MPGRELMLHPTHQCRMTLQEAADAARLHPEMVQKLVDYGLLNVVGEAEAECWFDVMAVHRLRTIQRLRNDLSINLPGIAVVLDLLERMEALERELKYLRFVLGASGGAAVLPRGE